ncbi:MAG: hypothetical protein AABX63_04680 [Nanoarchaeota archaeon]
MHKDRISLISEVEQIVEQEKHKLEEYSSALSGTFNHEKVLCIDQIILQSNLEDVELAKTSLDSLVDFVTDQNHEDSFVFNNVIKTAGYVLKKSVASRTYLLRHTPTLHGLPIVLDPTQNLLLSYKEHTVEYGRGGYILFQLPGQDPPLRYEDNPELKKAAEEMAHKLYGDVPNLRALIFTSGLASANTFNDFMKSLSHSNGRKNYIGDNCWVEIKKGVVDANDPTFAIFDETDTDKIMELLRDDSAQSISLEGIQNYATLHATDLEAIFSEVKRMDFKRPKYMLIDHVVTFDTNLYERHFHDGMPRNFCLAAFISGIKFTQAGWDMSKSGFLFLRYDPENFDEVADPYTKINDIRAMSGRVPSLEEAHLANIETSETIRSRMERYDSNMEYLAKALDARFKANGLGQVYSAWLPDHPDYETAMRNYGNGGRILYLKFGNHVTGEVLLNLYRYIADEAFKDNVPVMAASNFGFSSPHIHMVRHNVFGLSLRVSPGSTDIGTTKLFAQYLPEKIEAYFRENVVVGT